MVENDLWFQYKYLGNPSAVYSILAIWSLSLLTFGIDIPKDVAVPHSHKDKAEHTFNVEHIHIINKMDNIRSIKVF